MKAKKLIAVLICVSMLGFADILACADTRDEEMYDTYTYYFLAPDNWFDTSKGAYNDSVGCYWWQPNEHEEYPGIKMTPAPEIGDNVFKVENVPSSTPCVYFNAYVDEGHPTNSTLLSYAYRTWDIDTENYQKGDCPYDPLLTTDNFNGWIYVLQVDPDRYDFDRPRNPRFHGAWFTLDDYKNHDDHYGTYSAVNTIYGDVDNDGKITAKDSITVQRYTVKLKTLTGTQLIAADVTGDNKVTDKDAFEILRYTVNISKNDKIGKTIV